MEDLGKVGILPNRLKEEKEVNSWELLKGVAKEIEHGISEEGQD